MKHRTSTALYDYWLSCHCDTAVRAGVIDAADLAPLLPDIFLVDIGATEEPRFRFCGAAIARRYGRDLADESFLALWGPDDRRTLKRNLRNMASRSKGMVVGVTGETLVGGCVAYEMLILPIVGEHGGAGALGSMARIGGHDERNRIRSRIVSQSLRSVRFLPAASGARQARSAAVGALLQEPARPRRYGHLTLVSGGK